MISDTQTSSHSDLSPWDIPRFADGMRKDKECEGAILTTMPSHAVNPSGDSKATEPDNREGHGNSQTVEQSFKIPSKSTSMFQKVSKDKQFSVISDCKGTADSQQGDIHIKEIAINDHSMTINMDETQDMALQGVENVTSSVRVASHGTPDRTHLPMLSDTQTQPYGNNHNTNDADSDSDVSESILLSTAPIAREYSRGSLISPRQSTPKRHRALSPGSMDSHNDSEIGMV